MPRRACCSLDPYLTIAAVVCVCARACVYVCVPRLSWWYRCQQAEKPDDWDEEEDGEWEPALIKNPEYKGKWKPKMIPNPDYKGPWEHPMVANPDYKPDPKLGQRCTACTHVGFELWQVGARRRAAGGTRACAACARACVRLFVVVVHSSRLFVRSSRRV